MVRKVKRQLRQWQRFKLLFVCLLLCAFWAGQFRLPSWAQGSVSSPSFNTFQIEQVLPESQAHPLPDALAQWSTPELPDDYFLEVEPTPLGYLVWTEFPVRVFVEPVAVESFTSPNPAEVARSQQWITSVTAAMDEWNVYLPLRQVESLETADITIWRSSPPLQRQQDSEQPNQPTTALSLPRVRAAETRYQLFLDRPDNAPPRISHRFTIYLSPNQTADYTKATARHEIGHALGIWGHSPVETDALYFSQVRTSPPISERDINTLKRIYQQPTRIGWAIDLES